MVLTQTKNTYDDASDTVFSTTADRNPRDGSSTSSSTNTTKSWSLDALGNWQSNSLNGATTSRTSNSQNELKALSNATLGYTA